MWGKRDAHAHRPAMDKVEVPDRGSPSRSVSGANRASVCKKLRLRSDVLRLGEPRSGTLSMPLDRRCRCDRGSVAFQHIPKKHLSNPPYQLHCAVFYES